MVDFLVLKLVKLAKGVRSLLDTLFEALPQVCSIELILPAGSINRVLSTKNGLQPTPSACNLTLIPAVYQFFLCFKIRFS